MDTRYEHPDVRHVFSLEWTYSRWLQVEKATLTAQLLYVEPRDFNSKAFPDSDPIQNNSHPLCPNREARELLRLLNDPAYLVGVDVEAVRRKERVTRHDVVAFLEYVREKVGEDFGRWLHWGLTSSDVVDTTQGLRFKHLHPVFLDEVTNLFSELTRLTIDDSPLLARTHGQVAEPTTLRVRASHWLGELAHWVTLLSRAAATVQVCKLSGPVGTYAHNPPWVEREVARLLDLRPHGAGASQVALRAPLAAWASAAAGVVEACAKIALDVRLMKLTGEAFSSNLDGQVGSSAMPHKKNPIKEEQVGGLVRLARGYAQALQPLDLWLERDLSNSAVERVAVPDLWHVLLHTVKQTASFVAVLDVNEQAVFDQYLEAGVAPLTSTLTLENLGSSASVQEARSKALDATVTAVPETAAHFVRNYPGGPVK